MVSLIIAGLGLITTVVIAFATVVTTRLVKIQCRVAEDQRKDNLFKIRYEFYFELGKHIRNIANENFNENYYPSDLYEELLSGSDELAAKENFDSNLEEEWIFQTECLFNRKLANYLRKRLNYDARFKTFTFNTLIQKSKHFHPDYSSFYLSNEFHEKFSKFLKLK